MKTDIGKKSDFQMSHLEVNKKDIGVRRPEIELPHIKSLEEKYKDAIFEKKEMLERPGIELPHIKEKVQSYAEEEKKDLGEKDKTNENSENNKEVEKNEEGDERKDLSEDEINEKQKKAIKDAFEKIAKGEALTKEELGNLGEMMMDQYYISKGYKPLNKHRVTSLEDKKEGFKTGIDGVYEKENPDGSKHYVIVDAKYNTSQLSETNDGKQMSDNWIDKRLDAAVGKEKADEIRNAAEDNPNSVSHEVYHIDPRKDEKGNIHTDIQKVDSEGNKTGEKIVVESIDENGESTIIADDTENKENYNER